MKNKILKNIEWWIPIFSIMLCIVGFIALYSSTQSSNYGDLKKQLIFFAISLAIMIGLIFINYDLLVKISPVLYGISIILLIAVLFTKSINGAKSWFNLGFASLQPSEFAKVSTILFITYVICKIQESGKEEINILKKLLIILSVAILPIFLMILQPDYGTAIAYLVAVVMILFVAGIDKKYIIIAGIILAIGLPLIYNFVLPSHAKSRIEVFLNPELDPKGAGYNIIQSKIAIGSGELTGMGLLNGNQTQLGYLSPKTTDFIFSVISEEMGFIVSGGIIIVYVLLITKSLYVAKTAKDDMGTYVATGISGIFFFHMLENIGMTMGLLPITGVPLLFVSYGGSSLITSFICVAILMNISGNRQKNIFIK